eukprot:m.117655 g.117655  ORF g.117655 m.117655 type:complete len:369 (-) comp28594_c0_seq1:52-1158(-)
MVASHSTNAMHVVVITLFSLVTLSTAAPAQLLKDKVDAPHPVFVGTNIPWNHFGYDIGGGAFEPEWFETYFDSAKSNGSNIARFWLHADGRAGLVFDKTTGEVTGLTPTFLPELVQLVEIAENRSMVIQICLWSFDMCKEEAGPNRANLISNHNLTNTYLSNALRPMLGALTQHNNILFEIINEPEWCMKETPCNTKACVTTFEMQQFVASTAVVIHEGGFKVTVGSASLKWSAPNKPAIAFWFNDTALMAANPGSSCAAPTLDLYQIHYYDWMYNPTWGYDPMRANVSEWGLTDKLVVVGEIPTTSTHYSPTVMLKQSTENGFRGTLFWAYNDPSFPDGAAGAPMLAFAKEMGQNASYATLITYLEW